MSYTVQSYALHQRIINEINDLKKLDNIFINSDGVLYSDSSCQNVLELPISLELVTLQSIRVLKPVTITLSDIEGNEVYRATPLLVDDFNAVQDGDDVVVWEDVLNKPDFDNIYLKRGADNNLMPFGEFRFRNATFTDPDSGVTRDAKFGDKGIATIALKLGSASGIVKSVSGVLSASALLATEVPNLDASKITTGTFDLARLPALPSSNTIVCTTIPAMSAPDQALVAKGTVVIESSTGNTYRYSGTGSVVLNASYIQQSDLTPDWSVITNRPTLISTWTNDSGYLTNASNVAWAKITGTPTTLTGYGITDALTTSYVPSWASISGKPNTLAGYGIVDGDTLFDSKYLKKTTDTFTGTLTINGSLRIGTDAGFGLHGDGKNLFISLTSQANTQTGLIAPTTTTANNPIIGRYDYRWYGMYAGIGDFDSIVEGGQLISSKYALSGHNHNGTYQPVGDYSLNGHTHYQLTNSRVGVAIYNNDDALGMAAKNALGTSFFRMFNSPSAPRVSQYYATINMPETTIGNFAQYCIAFNGSEFFYGGTAGNSDTVGWKRVWMQDDFSGVDIAHWNTGYSHSQTTGNPHGTTLGQIVGTPLFDVKSYLGNVADDWVWFGYTGIHTSSSRYAGFMASKVGDVIISARLNAYGNLNAENSDNITETVARWDISGMNVLKNLVVNGNVYGANLAIANWNTAYTHSQASHDYLPRTRTIGGTDGYAFSYDETLNAGKLNLTLWDDNDGSEAFQILNNGGNFIAGFYSNRVSDFYSIYENGVALSSKYAPYSHNHDFNSITGRTKDVGDISARIDSGWYNHQPTTTALGWPANGSWWHLMSSTHENGSNYYAMQLAADFYAQDFRIRSTNGNGLTAWSTIWTSSNFTPSSKSDVGHGHNRLYRDNNTTPYFLRHSDTYGHWYGNAWRISCNNEAGDDSSWIHNVAVNFADLANDSNNFGGQLPSYYAKTNHSHVLSDIYNWGNYSAPTYEGIWPSGVTKGDGNFAVLWSKTNYDLYLNASNVLYFQTTDGTTRTDKLTITPSIATFSVPVNIVGYAAWHAGNLTGDRTEHYHSDDRAWGNLTGNPFAGYTPANFIAAGSLAGYLPLSGGDMNSEAVITLQSPINGFKIKLHPGDGTSNNECYIAVGRVANGAGPVSRIFPEEMYVNGTYNSNGSRVWHAGNLSMDTIKENKSVNSVGSSWRINMNGTINYLTTILSVPGDNSTGKIVLYGNSPEATRLYLRDQNNDDFIFVKTYGTSTNYITIPFGLYSLELCLQTNDLNYGFLTVNGDTYYIRTSPFNAITGFYIGAYGTGTSTFDIYRIDLINYTGKTL